MSQEIYNVIIDGFSALATISAVIVALFANKNATRQMREALKIQEQNKNVELFDKRVFIIEELKKTDINFQELEVYIKLLYNKKIVEEFTKLLECNNRKSNIENDLNYFKFLAQADDKTYGIYEKVQEIECISGEWSKQIEEEYEENIRKLSIYAQDEQGNYRQYEYKSLSKELDNVSKKFLNMKNCLV